MYTVAMSAFSIVGKKFDRASFEAYASHVVLGAWKPKRLVLHNTAVPSLKDRPKGLTLAHIQDLQVYYEYQAPRKNGKGWSGGPHLFVDQGGVWVFNPLDRKGVHSPSWNSDSWGIEMLGDYESEAFESGNGLLVQTNAIAALAALFRRLGIETITEENFKFHREDPLTDHACPGSNVHKPKVMASVQALLAGKPADDGIVSKVVVYRAGSGQNPSAVIEAVLRGGTVMADAKALSKATGIATSKTGEIGVRDLVGSKFAISWIAETHRAYLVEK